MKPNEINAEIIRKALTKHKGAIYRDFCGVVKRKDGRWYPEMLTDEKYLKYLGKPGAVVAEHGFTDDEFDSVAERLADIDIGLEKH